MGQRAKSGKQIIRRIEDARAPQQSIKVGASARTRETSNPRDVCRRGATVETASCIEASLSPRRGKLRVPSGLKKIIEHPLAARQMETKSASETTKSTENVTCEVTNFVWFSKARENEQGER